MNLSHFEKMESYIPLDLLTQDGMLLAFVVNLGFILFRYFAMVLPFYVSFWRWHLSPNKFIYLHDQKIRPRQIFFEIKWALISSLIFAGAGVLIGLLWQSNFSKIYLPLTHYPLWYLPVSFIIYALIHEFYFYFTHLTMHHPKIFPYVHATHHFSIKTSPWASFTFHPNEAIVHALFLPLMVCLIPIHPLVILAYLSFMTITAISNHLGVELLIPRFLQRYIISGTHHSLHHRKVHYNYGLYFTFIDRWFKTEYVEQKK